MIETSIPEFPKAGKEVADELEKVCMPPDKCKALWGWIARLAKLKEQLT